MIVVKYIVVLYKNVIFYIVDILGYVDFGGEVECVFEFVDGAFLVVDSFEGVMT